MDRRPGAVKTSEVAPRAAKSAYPEPFASRMNGREKRQLGDVFGITSFGVNLTRLAPDGETALLHRHSKAQEFVYVLAGHPTLVTEHGETPLEPGMCAGFTPDGPAHHLVNRTDADVLLLEIGDRVAGDAGSYPRDDLVAAFDPASGWTFTHKDGTPYP